MNCYYCGAPLSASGYCPHCGADVRIWKKVAAVSNRLYNEGLEKARVRDLSGAVEYLRMSLRYNKFNITARNLLGLVYFELGEAVNAASEWVISRSMAENDNPAAGYLDYIQKNPTRLDNLNQAIKKFNQALNYCRQGSYDLAAIQLKKVLSLNPRMVKAYQLTALLYMREGRYDQAEKTLRQAEKIDANNTNTMRYLKECHRNLKNSGRGRPSRERAASAQSSEDIFMRPPKLGDHTAVLTVANLLIGAAIGIAVVCFLIIPGIRQRANIEANSQLVKANESLSAREQTIQGLEEQIDTLNKQISDSKEETSNAGSRTKAYAALLDAYVSYADQKYAEAGEKVSGVDRALLDKNGQKIYDKMMEDVQATILQETFDEAMKLYQEEDYEGAIKNFTEILNQDEHYNNCEAAFYAAYSYLNSGDDAKALRWFRVVDENTSSASLGRTARANIRELDASSGSGSGND